MTWNVAKIGITTDYFNGKQKTNIAGSKHNDKDNYGADLILGSPCDKRLLFSIEED